MQNAKCRMQNDMEIDTRRNRRVLLFLTDGSKIDL